MRITKHIILMTICVPTLTFAMSPATTTTDYKTIVTTGKGQVQIPKTQATMQFTISEDGNDPQKIQNEVNTKANALIVALKSAKPSSIETSGISTTPKWSYADNTQKLTGYTASYSLTVKSKIQDSGKLVDIAADNGVNIISNPIFTASDKEKSNAELEAIKLATLDAQTKSNAALNALGLKAIMIRHISILPVDNPPTPYRFNAALARSSSDSAASSTTIEGGTDEVTASVELTAGY